MHDTVHCLHLLRVSVHALRYTLMLYSRIVTQQEWNKTDIAALRIWRSCRLAYCLLWLVSGDEPVLRGTHIECRMQLAGGSYRHAEACKSSKALLRASKPGWVICAPFYIPDARVQPPHRPPVCCLTRSGCWATARRHCPSASRAASTPASACCAPLGTRPPLAVPPAPWSALA